MILDQTDLDKVNYFLIKYKDQWKNVASLKDNEILRLSILKSLSHHIHTERSVALAEQETPDSQTLQMIDKIIKTKEIPLHIDELDQALLDPKLKKRTSSSIHLSSQFTDLIPAEAFDRYDLFWEKLILNEVLKRKWSLYFLSVTLPITDVETLFQSLKQKLWPSGVFITSKTLEVKDTQWSGGWIIATLNDYTPRLDPNIQFVRIDES